LPLTVPARPGAKRSGPQTIGSFTTAELIVINQQAFDANSLIEMIALWIDYQAHRVLCAETALAQRW
jgi:hypothetical protein